MREKHNIKQRKQVVVTMVIVFVLCLMLMPFEQLSFMASQAFADSNDLIDYGIGEEEHEEVITTSTDLKKMLWQINITPSLNEKEQEQKSELQSLIEELNSIELSLPDAEYDSLDESETTKEPEETFIQEEDTQSYIQNNITNNQILEAITNQTIQKLQKIAENPSEVKNPFEIGNTLYLSNNIGEAAVFYQEALKRKKPEDMSASDDRAWLLFQTGNSLRTIDMLAAADIYGKLITEYPDSPWAGYARVQRNVITWYLSDKPNELLKQANK